MWQNTLKQKLTAGDTVYGPFIRMQSPIPVELAATAGFDFALIDMEHSTIDLKTVESMVLAAGATGITPLVRVPEPNGAIIHQVLDVGAHGVMVPMVNTEPEARLVSEASKFGDFGHRGMAGLSRGDGWGALPVGETVERLHREVLTIAQIETARAVAKADVIASQPGIDLLFVGPFDLSQSLGVPGQVSHPTVVEAILRVIDVVRQHGKWTGIYAGTPEAARFWREKGVVLVGCGLDTAALQQAFKQMRQQVR